MRERAARPPPPTAAGRNLIFAEEWLRARLRPDTPRGHAGSTDRRTLSVRARRRPGGWCVRLDAIPGDIASARDGCKLRHRPRTTSSPRATSSRRDGMQWFWDQYTTDETAARPDHRLAAARNRRPTRRPAAGAGHHRRGRRPPRRRRGLRQQAAPGRSAGHRHPLPGHHPRLRDAQRAARARTPPRPPSARPQLREGGILVTGVTAFSHDAVRPSGRAGQRVGSRPCRVRARTMAAREQLGPRIRRFRRGRVRPRRAQAGPAILTPSRRRTRDPEVFADETVGQVADHYQRIIRTLTVKPALVGHSFGGLIVQMLAGRAAAATTVAIDPAPFRGVLPLRSRLSSLGSPWSGPARLPIWRS